MTGQNLIENILAQLSAVCILFSILSCLRNDENVYIVNQIALVAKRQDLHIVGNMKYTTGAFI